MVSSGGIPSKALPVLLDGGLVGGRKLEELEWLDLLGVLEEL